MWVAARLAYWPAKYNRLKPANLQVCRLAGQAEPIKMVLNEIWNSCSCYLGSRRRVIDGCSCRFYVSVFCIYRVTFIFAILFVVYFHDFPFVMLLLFPFLISPAFYSLFCHRHGAGCSLTLWTLDYGLCRPPVLVKQSVCHRFPWRLPSGSIPFWAIQYR